MRALVVALAVALVASSAAAAPPRTIKLGWLERTSPAYGFPAMTFKVADVVVTGKAWAVHGSVTNRSKQTIGIVAPDTRTYPTQYGFGLARANTSCPRNARCGTDEVTQTYAKPALPKQLAPGQTWKGVFGGPGKLPRQRIINVTFGFFVVSQTKHFSWNTTNSFRL